MPTAMRLNNENEAPPHVLANRPGKMSRKAFNVLDDIGKAEKRPRGLKPQVASSSTASSAAAAPTRRPALGDVTNRLGGVKRATAASSSAVLKKQQQQQPAKRPAQPIAAKLLVETTPMARTFGSLDLASPLVLPADKSPLCEKEEEKTEEDHDIDSADVHDPAACWQYAADIAAYHLEREKSRRPSPAYMARQSDINSKMRAILIDWLVDVHSKYDLLPQTLHIASQLIDTYLSTDLSVARQKLQLVGVTALFIASKYEEIYPPEADDFVRITDNAYTKDQLFSMEEQMLAKIGYRVTFPTSFQFMKRFLKASRTTDDRVAQFAHYVIDRSLQEYKMIKYLPSTIAASAVHLARTQMRDLPAWSSTLEHHSSYTEHSLTDCLDDLKEMLWNAHNHVGKTSKLTAVRRKFSKERFLGVASHPLQFDDAA